MTTSNTWAARLISALYLHRRIAIGVVLALVAGAAVFAPRWFVADNSARVWLLEGDPALEAYDEFQDQFGNDEVVVVAVFDRDGVYSPDNLERIRAASERLLELEKIRRVSSIAISLHIDGDEIEIIVEPLLGDGPITPEEAARVQQRVEADPALRRTLVNDANTATLIVAQLATVDEMAGQRSAILKDVRRIVDETIVKPGGDAALGGIGVIYDELNKAVLRDTVIFISLSFLVILAGLGLLFRRLLWVGVGLAIIVAATVVAAGGFGLLGRKMNMVTSIVPTLILTVGILDLVHLIDAHERSDRAPAGVSAGKALEMSLAIVVVPCVFNSITDIIGFLALASAKMSAIRDFGLMSSFGLLVLLVISFTFTLPALARFGRRRPKPDATSRSSRDAGVLLSIVRSMGGLATRQRGLVLGLGVVLALVAAFGIYLVRVDTYTIEFLDESHRARRDHERIERVFGEYLPLEITIEAPVAGAIKEPPLLRTVEAIERDIEGHQSISRVTGLPEVVSRIHQIVMDGKPEEHRIPDSRGAIAELLLLYESNAESDVDHLVDNDFKITRVTSRMKMTTARGVRDIIEDLEATGRSRLDAMERPEGDPPPATLKAAGYLPLYVRIIDHIATAQVTSFSIAFGLIAIVLMLLLRSVRLGLIALVPNLLPAAMTLGLMGIVGVRLDVGTVLLASIIIGISVNDTSHLMFRFRHELRQTPGDPPAALDRTLASTGRAILASSLLLIAGFAVLGLASTRSVANFGLFSSFAVASAVVADLLITPALLLTFTKPELGGRGHQAPEVAHSQ